MKIFLLYASFIILLISCKNEPMLYDVGKGLDIAEIKTDFIRKTGYRQSDSSFINPSFKSVVDWNTFYEVGMDTLYVKVDVADRLEISVSESKRILLNDNVWIRGTKKNDKWQYSVLTFIPSSNTREYSGIIISKSLQSGTQNISFYEANVKVPFQLVKRAGKAPAMPTDCIYGYVNGVLNEISCSGGSGDGDGTDDPPYSGDPRDYQNIPPLGDGGSGGNGDGTVPIYTSDEDKEIIDSLQGYPCAQQILAILPYLKSDISDLIDQTFNGSTENGFKNVKFSAVDANIIGQKVDGDAGGNILSPTIRLNKYVLENSSQEYVVATMIHEALHAYLNFSKQSLGSQAFQQQFPSVTEYFDANSNRTLYLINQSHSSYGPFVNAIKDAILNYNPQFDPQKAYALALMGVVTRSSMSEQEIRVNDQERNRKTNPLGSGTLCDPTKL